MTVLKSLLRNTYVLFFLLIRKTLRVINSDSPKHSKTVLVYPGISEKSELISIINKICWLLPESDHFRIEILTELDNTKIEVLKDVDLKHQRNYISNGFSHIELVSERKRKYDVYLVWKMKAIWKIFPFIWHKVEVLDNDFFSVMEGDVIQSLNFRLLPEERKEKSVRESNKIFDDLVNSFKSKKDAVCFVTGPSFDSYREFDSYYRDSLKIICNSTVKNKEFLEFIGGPDIIVFADPVFHFSTNSYSSYFRDQVLEVVRKYKCFVIVPINAYGLLLTHYPELSNYLIGMGTDNEFIIFPSVENLIVKGSANILTLFMIPIASALCENVFIIGADGRNPKEKYFWKHSKSVQFDDLMESVFISHPSFFRDRNYKKYYKQHCNFLESLLQFGESKGVNYSSLTESHIPALKRRSQIDRY